MNERDSTRRKRAAPKSKPLVDPTIVGTGEPAPDRARPQGGARHHCETPLRRRLRLNYNRAPTRSADSSGRSTRRAGPRAWYSVLRTEASVTAPIRAPAASDGNTREYAPPTYNDPTARPNPIQMPFSSESRTTPVSTTTANPTSRSGPLRRPQRPRTGRGRQTEGTPVASRARPPTS